MDKGKLLGIETINSKKGVFYKYYIGFSSDSCLGYIVRDYFTSKVFDVSLGDEVELVFGAGYDMKAYLKEIKRV